MLIRRPEEYKVTKDTELTEPVKIFYMTLKKSYGINGRISDIIQMLEKLYGDKFELFDPRTWNTGQFASYLMDQQIKFQKGEVLDMVVLHDDILKVYDFTGAEKKRFINESIEEKIWAIFKFVTNPNLVFNNIINI